MASDVGERGRGDEAHGERAREVVVLATALVTQVKRVLLLALVGVAEQDHLTQEGVHDHVLVVDLLVAHPSEEGRDPEAERGAAGKERTGKDKKAISGRERENYGRINTRGIDLNLIGGRRSTEMKNKQRHLHSRNTLYFDSTLQR